MQFSKCSITQSGSIITIEIAVKKQEFSFSIPKSDFKEFAIYRKKVKVNVNRWLLGAILLTLLILSVLLSEYIHSDHHSFPFWLYSAFNLVDNYLMIVFFLLFFATLFFDIMGGLRVVRWLIELPLVRRESLLVIILDKNREYEIPVKNDKEANCIISTYFN